MKPLRSVFFDDTFHYRHRVREACKDTFYNSNHGMDMMPNDRVILFRWIDSLHKLRLS